jgi:hypothetical protein
VTLLNGPAAEQLYDQLIRILQFGLTPRARTEQGEGDS